MKPNRIVGYGVAALSLLVVALPVIAEVDWTTVASALGGLAAISAVALKWLQGWQNYETAQYQAQILGQQQTGRLEAEAEAIRQRDAAGKPGARKLDLPR